jgi:hypothetical protein
VSRSRFAGVPAARRSVVVIAGCALLAGASGAGAAVRIPAPGVMRVTNLPSQVPAGHTFTLREVLPFAVHFGSIHLQRQMPSGVWHQVASASVAPRVFWLHWRVPADWAGSTLTVRFVLKSHAEILALSPGYQLTVAGPTLAQQGGQGSGSQGQQGSSS